MGTASNRAARAGALAKLESTLKFRYLGIGFVWAWIYGSYETFAVYPERTGVGINADASWLASAGTVVVVLLLGSVLLRNRPIAHEKPFGLAAAALMATGTILSALAPGAPDLASALAVASGLCSGVGSGALYLVWGQALSRLDADTAEVAVPAASIIMIICALVLPYLQGYVGVVATASLPIISGVMLALTLRDLATEKSEATATARPAGSAAPVEATRPTKLAAEFMRIAVMLFLAYFSIGCSGALQLEPGTPFSVLGIDLPTIIGSGCGIALMACFILFSARTTFDSLFRLIAPLIVTALSLLPWADLWAEFLSETFVSGADTVLQIATVLFVVKAAQGRAARAAAGIGLCQGAVQLGVLAGNMLGRALATQATASPADLFAITLALVVAFSLSWFAYPAHRRTATVPAISIPTAPGREEQGIRAVLSPERPPASAGTCPETYLDPRASLSAEPDKRPHMDPGANTANTPAHNSPESVPVESSLEATCRLLAAEHGLSAREAEILGYLARGRSQPYIREELVLSKNTVATHVKHIYQKLDVHSRQELLDLFE